ncbi:MAG: glycosyltransferase family 4 protein [Lachnospiraceae bacterium]|nr:glycosyltransferase family 4 protein [Lachnospiraceae bacterium]
MSGGDRRLIEILRLWQDRASLDIYLYTTNNFSNLLKEEKVFISKIFITDSEKKSNIIASYFKRQKKCQEILMTNIIDGDVIYSPTDIMPDVIPAIYAKKHFKEHVKWGVITYHIYEAFYKRPGNILTNFLSGLQQKYDIKLAKKYADVMMSTSAVVLKLFKNQGWNENRLRLIDCAVDIDAISNANDVISGYDAVFLARLNYSKGIMELPEIWNRVCEKHPTAKLAIVGNGSEEIVKEMKEKIDLAGVGDNIDMCGFMETSEVFSLMKNSKLFLFTSHEEGWGMAIAEAMVCGLPVVAYDLEIYKYIFREGILVCDLQDVDNMAKKVCQLLDNDEYRKKLGLEGKKYIESHYSFELTAKKELKILTNLL